MKANCLKNIIIIFSCAIVFCGCKKKGVVDEPVTATRLVKIESSATIGGIISYDNQQRISNINGLINGSDNKTYTYTSLGDVNSIKVSNYDGGVWTYKEFKINYLNSVPVSGTMKYTPEVSSKTVNPTFYVDSLSYKVISGHVTQMIFFDRKTYNYYTKALLSAKTDTTEKFILSYANDNLTKLQSNSSIAEFTYGNNKGWASAYKMKFILEPEDLPGFYSTNELLTATYNKTKSDERVVKYNYAYNNLGFPTKSSVSSMWPQSGGSLNYELTFQYQ